jgi:hypothetical protein
VKIAVYHNLGEISPNPHPLWSRYPLSTFLWTYGSAMESFVTLAITETEYITNRQTFFFRYIDFDRAKSSALTQPILNDSKTNNIDF